MKSFISVFGLFVATFGYSQQKITEHFVLSNETIVKIANNYKVRQSEILELNPDATNGVKLNQVLFIPVAPSPKSTTTHSVFLHNVQPKETLYSISRDYKVEVNDIYKANPAMGNDIKIGQKLVIYKTQASTHATPGFEYEVLPKDTKYSIAKSNNLTIADLQNANPILIDQDLKVGQKIIIPNKQAFATVNQTVDNKTQTTNTGLLYEVLPKETKYGIAKKFNITVEELEKVNPEIISGLTVGKKIYLPSPSISTPQNHAIAQKTVVEKNENNASADLIEKLVVTAFQNIGTRYRPGGTTRDEGFDCSGLMINTFSTFDINLPRSSSEQAQSGVIVDVEQAKKGDLVFFRNSGGSINHVGMVVEVKDGDVKFIHAASTGVIVSSIKENYYSKRLAQFNRVL